MLKKQHELLKEFIKTPWKKFTFQDIKKLSGKKSESYVYNNLKDFVKEGILKEQKAGNVTLYYLNISSLKAQMYAGFVAGYISWNSKHLPFKNIAKLTSEISNTYNPFIITGSYARNKQTPNSDVDVVIIINDNEEPNSYYAKLQLKSDLSIPPIHLYVFRRKEFLEMLLNKEENYGKEIVKNNLILSGGAEYFNIINEAMEHGF